MSEEKKIVMDNKTSDNHHAYSSHCFEYNEKDELT